ncbi:MAG: hypothetical protein AB9846_03130 [Tenuifilaceae bacterium]
MKVHNCLLVFVAGALFLLLSCDKEDYIIGDNVELYLIESYETIDNSSKINESTVITEANPLIYYSDFISYNPSSYIFEISSVSKERVENLEHTVLGIPFAIKVDNKLVYTGYFWPSYSSAICNWIIMDPLRLYSGNELKVVLGYPGLVNGEAIPDKRNDRRILDVFRRDNKLIE